jgi:sulfhydrogenase subunit alpha
MVHGENPTVGGFGKYPDEATLLDIKKQASEFMDFTLRGVDLVASLEIPSFFEEETVFMCCEPGDNDFGLGGDQIRISDGSVVDAKDYKELSNEFLVPYSAAKHCRYKEKPFTVGAIARINNLGERMKGKAEKLFKKYWNERWLNNPVFNNLAQAIELVWALQRIPGVVDSILKIEEAPELVKPTQIDGEGVGAVEAPRGKLYHHYQVKDGLVAKTKFVIPTAQNLEDIDKYLHNAVEAMLARDADNDSIRLQAEIIVRSYDPCISCATHLVKIEREN